MTDINQLREQTYQETRTLLQQYQKACIIRPTAFGKTGILARFLTSGEYQHILYLYPSQTVKDAAETLRKQFQKPGPQPQITYYSYLKIQNLSDTAFRQLKNTDLIICDECHKLGGYATGLAYETLLEELPNAHQVGATATPDRMDLIDIVKKYYENHVVSKYTAHDAYTDGILYRPHYFYCTYTEADIEEAEQNARTQIALADPDEQKSLTESMKAKLIQISNLYNMGNIIRNACDQYAKDTNCMSFIIFFTNFNHLRTKKEQVASWFKDAYPTHDIRPITVTSEKQEYRENLELIADLPDQNHTIYLILTCDMLNLGYHISKTTGLLLYRSTSSNNIFIQQLGRIINQYYPGIVFDAVDNLHRQAIYSVLGKRSEKNKKKKERLKELEQKVTDNKPLTSKEKTELKQLRLNFNPERWWTNANDLEPKDLIATDHEAKYRELIAKVVAEPISMRCRQAWQRWIEKGGDPSSMDKNQIMNQKDPDYVPLTPFCKLKHVSIEAVLQEMGL